MKQANCIAYYNRQLKQPKNTYILQSFWHSMCIQRNGIAENGSMVHCSHKNQLPKLFMVGEWKWNEQIGNNRSFIEDFHSMEPHRVPRRVCPCCPKYQLKTDPASNFAILSTHPYTNKILRIEYERRLWTLKTEFISNEHWIVTS